jgi:large conductance mechanosensitive channel
MKIFQEFKAFAMRGNMIDLAVGIVIGAAFTGIVNSLVSDLINPIIGAVIGGTDFSNYFVVMSGGGPFATLADAQAAGAATLNYGLFINAVIRFLVVALALFILIKQINRLIGTAKPAEAPPTPEEVLLLREIRDSLNRKA